MRIILFVSLLSVIFVRGGIAENLNEYSLTFWGYPNNSGGCVATARRFAVRFYEMTGVAKVQGRCRGINQNDGTYTIEIQYIAERPFRKVDTYDGNLGQAQGTYLASQLTKEVLNKEIERFTRLTGLQVFVAYFKEDFRDGGDKNWIAEVIGLGDAEVLPLVQTTETIFSVRREFFSKIEEDVSRGLQARGIEVSSIAANLMPMGFRFTVRYFAPFRYFFQLSPDFLYRTAEQCRWAERDISMQLSKAQNPPLTVFCNAPDNYNHSASIVMITVSGPGSFTYRTTSKSFYSFRECIDKRQEVLTEYQALLLNDNAFGATCSVDANGQYNVVLFIQN